MRVKVGETIVTREPFLLVDAGHPPGTYRFQLIVDDDDEQPSLPDELKIVIRERIVVG